MRQINVFLVTLVLAIVSSGCSEMSELPSDAYLIEKFKNHRLELDKIRKMSDEDFKVIRIADDFTWLEDDWSWPRSGLKLGFSEERWAEYRRLFRTVGLQSGIDRSSNGSIFFFVATKGLGNGHGLGKGFAYLLKPAVPVLTNLDEASVSSFYSKDHENKEPIYKRLAENWYIFAEH